MGHLPPDHTQHAPALPGHRHVHPPAGPPTHQLAQRGHASKGLYDGVGWHHPRQRVPHQPAAADIQVLHSSGCCGKHGGVAEQHAAGAGRGPGGAGWRGRGWAPIQRTASAAAAGAEGCSGQRSIPQASSASPLRRESTCSPRSGCVAATGRPRPRAAAAPCRGSALGRPHAGWATGPRWRRARSPRGCGIGPAPAAASAATAPRCAQAERGQGGAAVRRSWRRSMQRCITAHCAAAAAAAWRRGRPARPPCPPERCLDRALRFRPKGCSRAAGRAQPCTLSSRRQRANRCLEGKAPPNRQPAAVHASRCTRAWHAPNPQLQFKQLF